MKMDSMNAEQISKIKKFAEEVARIIKKVIEAVRSIFRKLVESLVKIPKNERNHELNRFIYYSSIIANKSNNWRKRNGVPMVRRI